MKRTISNSTNIASYFYTVYKIPTSEDRTYSSARRESISLYYDYPKVWKLLKKEYPPLAVYLTVIAIN